MSRAPRDVPAAGAPPSLPRERHPFRVRAMLAGASLLLAAASVLHHLQGVSPRGEAERLARALRLDVRRPEEFQTIRVAPGDSATDVLADTALREAEAGARESSGPRPRDPATAARSASTELLNGARDLLLSALVDRPGDAIHLFLLGRLAFAEQDAGAPSSRELARIERWRKPLRAAASAAPGLDAIWGALTRAYLEAWPRLPPSARQEGRVAFRRAFLDPGLVTRDFLAARNVLGPGADLLLPEDAAPIAAAVESLEGRAGVPATMALLKRLDRARRVDRAARLKEIERLHRRADFDRLRIACESLAATHPVFEFDDETGRRQAARVLDLWPAGDVGSWPDDRRAEIVRFFLGGREAHVRPAALARALASLSGVPRPVHAEVLLLNGELADAEDLAVAASAGAGESDWRPYFVRLARSLLARGRSREALLALSRVEIGGREECDVLRARRDVARALGDADEEKELEQTIAALRGASQPRKEWARRETLSLCLGPEELSGRELSLEAEAASPVLLQYGWDGGRSGLLAIRRSGLLRIPLPRAPGARLLSIEARVGGPFRLREVRLETARRGIVLAWHERAILGASGPGEDASRPVPPGAGAIIYGHKIDTSTTQAATWETTSVKG